MRNQRKLLIEQLDKKIAPFKEAAKMEIPQKGWIHAIRTTLNMSLKQLAKKMNLSNPSGVKDMEDREAMGSISIKTLKEAGKALEMNLVYGFVPIHGSIDELIDEKAKDMAEKIVLRTNHHMKLEDQGNSNESLQKAIKDLAIEIKREMKKSLWD